MLVDLLVIDDAECEEGWLCLTFPWEAMPLETEIIDLVGRLLPDAVDLDTLQLISEFDHQQLDPNQIGFTWSVLPEG
ncbi:hypothetical protein SAMN04515680_0871 [Leifsonia sp. 21MFCrub1.1]|nr:hypothetical protein SAMN04515680_0871 [Leifsonia sp. 21MFCrub1.1]